MPAKSTPTLVHFGVSHTYRDEVQRQAVLFPLLGPPGAAGGPPGTQDAADAAIVAKATTLRQWWRARVYELSQANWEMTRPGRARRRGEGTANSRRTRLFQCPSPFVVSRATATCGVAAICPHCWARQAGTVWETIDRRLYGESVEPVAVSPEAVASRALSFGDAPVEEASRKPPHKHDAYDLIRRKVVYTCGFGADVEPAPQLAKCSCAGL